MTMNILFLYRNDILLVFRILKKKKLIENECRTLRESFGIVYNEGK